MTSISSLSVQEIRLPPSCIAFCPSLPVYFVIGTYLLHDTTGSQDHQERSGSLIIYQLIEGAIQLVTTKPTPDFAVLDLQWSPKHDLKSHLLGVATSTGRLAFYKLVTGEQFVTDLVPVTTKSICDEGVLVLSLSWHPERTDTIGVTLSDGRICVCNCFTNLPSVWGDESELKVTTVFTHGLEAWTSAFSISQSLIYSGGDDAVLALSSMVHDAPDATADDRAGLAQWQDRRIHQAGVTAILPISDDLVLTGSYDDHIRLISTPAVGRKAVLAELNLQGGVWRLKLLAAQGYLAIVSEGGTSRLSILASCMHAGTRIVQLLRDTKGVWSFDVLAKFEEHKSMNYGSDVQPSTGMIVSTSFYDKLMCLWASEAASNATLNYIDPDQGIH